MFKKNLVYLLIFTVILTLIANPAQANKNRIVELQGNVKIKRNGANNEQNAFKGMTLFLGDILLPDEGATVRIHCSDNKIRKAQSGVPSGLNAICPGARSTDPRGDDNIFLDLVRGDFIYQSGVLDNTPLLIWPKIEKATGYKIKLMAGNQVIWEMETEETSIQYSGENLRPKFPYRLEVEAVNGDNISSYQLQLIQVEPVIADLIQEKITALKAENLTEEATALILVDYYQDSSEVGAFLRAAILLEKLVQQGNKTPVIHRMLGDIYVRLGRGNDALERYQAGFLLAETENNFDEVAASKVGLAHVAVMNKNLSQAKELLQEAQMIYQTSGNNEQVDKIQGWLRVL